MDKKTLLVVEDSRVQSKIICQRFEALTSFPLLAAYSKAETEHLASAHKDELFAAVVDLNLPDAAHGEAVDICLAHGIPCIVLAATFDDAMRKTLIDKHVVDYFLKGGIGDLESLVAAVQRIYANYSVKALVVDDFATQRAAIRKLLAVQCISSVAAEDGVAALEMLEAHPEITLVITDYNMPRMDGIELVKAIREKHKIHRMAVIGLSSSGSGALTARFLKNGANDFLTTPFEAEEFYWRVNQTLNILGAMDELRTLRGHR